MRFNSDLLLASAWQDSELEATATRGAVILCDVHHKTYAAGATSTEKTFKTIGPFTGKNKCSYIVQLDKTLGAPAFRLVKADALKWQFQYVEYETAAVAAGGFLPKVNATPFYGTYDIDFLNPIAYTAATATVGAFGGQYFANESTKLPGSIGKFNTFNYGKQAATMEDSYGVIKMMAAQ